MDQFNTIPKDALVQPKPFALHVPDKDIADFKALLELSKIGPETWENSSRKFGITRDWLVKAKDAWLNDFSWRAHEKHINSFPNFKTVIKDAVCGDLTVHFVALFSKKVDAVPIMMMHGWPGSFLEFLPLLTLLSKKYSPETLPYHVVVPSLPGYTLSDGPPLDMDFTMADLTRIMNQLMVDLGFGKKGYVAQGGDVGSMVARLLAPTSECKAIHVNMMMPKQEDVPNSTEGLTTQELDTLTSQEKWIQTGMAYAMEHGTRPGTIGLVLSSSPLSLLAWIGEKLLDWVDPEQPLAIDTILAMISLYWFTNSFPRSIYPYRALGTMNYPDVGGKPFGYSHFRSEMVFMPAAWCKTLYPDMIRYEHDKGGHFAALEQPTLLLDDVEDFVAKIRGVFK